MSGPRTRRASAAGEQSWRKPVLLVGLCGVLLAAGVVAKSTLVSSSPPAGGAASVAGAQAPGADGSSDTGANASTTSDAGADGNTDSAQVRVPSFDGLTFSQASQLAEQVGLRLSSNTHYDGDGTVLHQSRSTGNYVDRGTTVFLTIGTTGGGGSYSGNTGRTYINPGGGSYTSGGGSYINPGGGSYTGGGGSYIDPGGGSYTSGGG